MKWSRLLRFLGVGSVLVVMAVGPFLRGLFFWTELLGAISLLSLGFALWLIGRRLDGEPVSLTGGVPGLALLALLACYLIQFAWAVYPRGNLDWVLRVAAGFMVYVMMRAEAGPALRRGLAWVLVLSAAAVAVVGFLEFTGYFANNPELMQSLNVVNLGDRMATTFQYPNTAAVYLLVALFVALGLAVEDLKSWKLIVLTSLATLLSLAFFFTVSRGAVVVLPFGLAVLFAGLDRENRWPAFLFLLAAIGPMVVALRGVGANAAIHNWISAFRWITAATVGGLVTGTALALFLRWLPAKAQRIMVGGFVVLAVIGLVVVRTGGGLLPKQAARLLDINLRTTNVAFRLIYQHDAMHMVADRPLGRGGWGWARSYQQYQEFNYTARETHNQYAQTAVEAGMLGLAALAAALLGALVTTWRSRKGNSLGWALAAGGLLVAGHSLIDFDLSYGAVWLLVWMAVAAGAAPAAITRWESKVLWAALGGSVAVAGFALVLGIGSAYTDKAFALQEAKRPEQAVATARKAVSFDPRNSDPYALIGDRVSLQRAAEVDPGRADVQFNLAIKLELEKNLPAALQAARAALADQPMVSSHYTKAADLAGLLMVDALGKGDQDTARGYADELVKMGSALAQRKAVGDPLQTLWNAPKLVMEPAFQLRYGQALYLVGNLTDAEGYLQSASKVGLLGSEADVWLYAMYERAGNKPGMAALEQKPWVRFRNVNPVYKALKDM